MQETEKILFVINSGAGRDNKLDWESLIKKYFTDLPFDLKFFSLEKEKGGKELDRVIKNYSPHRIVAVGGDGTVTLVVKKVIGSDVTMGIIPAGSANGMAKELNIPNTPEEAFAVVANGEIKRADAIRVNEKEICFHLCDIGMNAQLIKYFEDSSVRGKIGYAKLIFKVLFKKRRLQVKIETAKEEILRSAIMVGIANASQYGTGAAINPDGNIYDGVFEVIVVRKLGVKEILQMFLKRKRFNPKKIEVIGARSVSIETKHSTHFQIDGEYLGKIKNISARIISGEIKILVPQQIVKAKN